MLHPVISSWDLHVTERDSPKGFESKAAVLFVESLRIDFRSVLMHFDAGVFSAFSDEDNDPSEEDFNLFNGMASITTGVTSFFELVEKIDFGDSTLWQIEMEDFV